MLIALLESLLCGSCALIELIVAFEVGSIRAIKNGGRAATFEVGDEQCERFVNAIAPLRDIVAI